MQKNVQISYELFIDLIKFHLFGFDENEAKIRIDLERKLNTMCERELYTKYKTAGTDAERGPGKSIWTAGESRRTSDGDFSLSDTDRDVSRPC